MRSQPSIHAGAGPDRRADPGRHYGHRHEPASGYGPVTVYRRQPPRQRRRLARLRRLRRAALVLAVMAGLAAGVAFTGVGSQVVDGAGTLTGLWRHGSRDADTVTATAPAGVLVSGGQSAYLLERDGKPGPIQVSSTAADQQTSVPIASVAKVMTAYLVLRHEPLGADSDGPTIVLTDADVADTERRRADEESIVPIVAGEQLTERQALQALLLPSANNIAVVLARHVAGSEQAFVAKMNRTAGDLGMSSTRYTDPSGMDAGTVSTARDQVLLFHRAMALPAFARIVGQASAQIPVAGTIRNTNHLLGQDGFVGGKTGSHDAAGGCFVFEAIRQVGGQTVAVYGAVLGQRDGPYIDAALHAADALADRAVASVAGQDGVPDQDGVADQDDSRPAAATPR